MTDTEIAYLRTVYDAVLWLAEELRQRDPNSPLPETSVDFQPTEG